MAVKIRLTRVGKKRQPSYRVVVADSRSPRDGRYIEQIGRYDPTADPSIVEIDNERASYWMERGAQPSSQVRKLLEISGSLAARPVKDPKVHVVGEAAQMAAEAEPEVAVDDKVVDMTDDGEVEPAEDTADEESE
ncbi:MAG TPA: 30S ribosomal protein S16 [Acidimicrobiia bacterium]|nr:30S ribosomal protein S16 [Acidimicrobiia bacterium]